MSAAGKIIARCWIARAVDYCRLHRWPLVTLWLMVVLTCLSGPTAFAQVEAGLHMSVEPGGGEVTAVRSGTVVVYAVLSYQNATDTELKVQVRRDPGVVLFEQSAVYNGSGQTNIEISGRDILAGYVSAAQQRSDELVEVVDRAQQASSARAKRLHTESAVFFVTALDSVLAALERYPLPSETLDSLPPARKLADQVEAMGLAIINDVPDDELDSELARLETLVTETVAAVDLTMDGIDTHREWPLIDGTYPTQLYRNGQISQGFVWEVSPEGTPGVPWMGFKIFLPLVTK
ncbi:MAG: hypothetical protein ACE5LU_14970 [Anaerolineae bacterium]